MRLLLQCMFSPRLYKVYRDGPRDSMYQPQGLEKWGDKIISSASTLFNISLYASPLICMYLYRRGFFSHDEIKMVGWTFGGIGCLMAFAFFIRGCGRAYNEKYVQFIQVLSAPTTDRKAYLESIRKYDFEFDAWPVSYKDKQNPTPQNSWLSKHPFTLCANEDRPFYQRVTIQILAFIATHTFGLRLIYPGSLGLVQNLLWNPLLQGRTELVEVYGGKRAKLGAVNGNDVDTMFIDKRSHSPKGKFLVICCEGNSGFYEIGIMTTPVKAGYSALGWNHPGFAGSTGWPYPDQEHYAIDVVMQYAINELGFLPEQLVLFGWSIGGYSASWAAVNYPIRALILDATFDDLLPLAENHMPRSWNLLVKEVVRSYVDLNIAELLKKYDGPIQLVRRTEDEIICLRQGHLSSNRGNDLLLKIIDQRHPDVMASPAVKSAMYRLLSLQEMQRDALSYSETKEFERPLLELITRYMRDYRSTHCTPLPEELFVDVLEGALVKHG